MERNMAVESALEMAELNEARVLTRYARLSPAAAGAVLLALLFCMDFCFVAIERVKESVTAATIDMELDDALLYRAVTRRVRRSEDYYTVAAEELRARHYPCHSIFNWRVPTYAWFLGAFPSPVWAQMVFGACVALAIVTMLSALPRSGGPLPRIAAAAGLAGSYGWALHPYPICFMELWSGLFTLISALCIGAGRWGRGVAAGVVALAFRELALPYLVLAALTALTRRRWRALFVLFAALAAYLILFCSHYHCVSRHVDLAATGHFRNWLVWGGWPFILATSRMNGLLAVLPLGWTAVYVPLAVLGLWSWPGPVAVLPRATAFGYLLFFAMAGKPFDFYWGWMCMPLLFLGFLWFPLALRDLLFAAAK